MSKKKIVPQTVSMEKAKFAYFSHCCQEIGEKPSCAVAKGKGLGLYLGAKPEGEATLGSWRCSKCKKPCKVTRTDKATVVPVQETLHVTSTY
jgi:hypothetical protein